MDNLVLGLAVTVVGVVPKGIWPCIVTKMTHVDGAEPSADELHHDLLKKGFVDQGDNTYLHHSGITISDAHTGNFILTASREYVPIDIHIGGDASQCLRRIRA